jgi:hypothetical protein
MRTLKINDGDLFHGSHGNGADVTVEERADGSACVRVERSGDDDDRWTETYVGSFEAGVELAKEGYASGFVSEYHRSDCGAEE